MIPVPKVATIDFETFGIEGRPDYPPKPVGVSIELPGRKPKYYSWGHPKQNNCTKAEAVKALKHVYKTYPILCHNAKFDLDVGNTHLGLPLIPRHGYHDTQYLAFLHNPHSEFLALKPLSEQLLDMPPEEQDAVKEWILSNVWLSSAFTKGAYKIKVGGARPKGWKKVPPTKTGAFIYLVPGKLAGTYANSDTDRTTKLFKFYWDSVINKFEMLEPYNRELKLMAVLMKCERGGIKINEKQLKKDRLQWVEWIVECDRWIRKRLKNKNLNVDSGEEFADAIEAAGKVDEWVYTKPSKAHPDGQRSVAKDNLALACTDNLLVTVYQYRGVLVNSVRNFAKPWLMMAAKSDGFISTNWNQVRQTNATGKGGKGARTGRLSSNPNFQNIPKRPRTVKLPIALERLGLGGVPFMRQYIIPDKKGNVLINRDYSQQELRILGHFEDAVLRTAYNDNPTLDLHQLATDLINNMLGTNFDRKPIKNMGFGLIYGMGLGLLADNMGVDKDTAKVIKSAYLRIFPGLKELDQDLKHRGKMGDYIRTWGGRVYFVEPPRIMKDTGQVRTFEYKLLNVLIQGSAADCTKEAMIRYDEIKKHGRIILNVHDEIMVDVPKEHAVSEMKLLKQAMESVTFDVPMLSDGKKGSRNWGEMKACR